MSFQNLKSSSAVRFIVASLLSLLILIFTLFYLSTINAINTRSLSTDMTIKEAAQSHSISPRVFAMELGLNEPVSKQESMNSLGVSAEVLAAVDEHLSAHVNDNRIFIIYIAAVISGFLYLFVLARKSKSEYKRLFYIAILLAVIVLGFLFGKSPNPMQSVSKLLKALDAIYPDFYVKLAIFGFFIILSVITNKVVCGWACPFGALQELIYSIPILGRIKKKRIPFVLSNTVRVVLFLLAILFLFGGIAVREGRVLYHNINIFNMFDMNFEDVSIVITMIVVLLLSMFTYRPFCNLICPFGLISWIFERISIFRIKIDRDKCINCNKCKDVCPTRAAGDYLDNVKIPADCFSCGRCIDLCPTDAITFR